MIIKIVIIYRINLRLIFISLFFYKTFPTNKNLVRQGNKEDHPHDPDLHTHRHTTLIRQIICLDPTTATLGVRVRDGRLSTRGSAEPARGFHKKHANKVVKLKNNALHRYATPFTAALFIISAVSGAALFFHWQGGLFHLMHVWLSMVLLVPFVLHIWRNWRATLGYFRHRTIYIPAIICLLVAVIFAINGLAAAGRRSNPMFAVMQTLTAAPIANLAPLMHTTPDRLVERLKDKGLKVDSDQVSLDQIASASGTGESRDLLTELMTRDRGARRESGAEDRQDSHGGHQDGQHAADTHEHSEGMKAQGAPGTQVQAGATAPQSGTPENSATQASVSGPASAAPPADGESAHAHRGRRHDGEANATTTSTTTPSSAQTSQ